MRRIAVLLSLALAACAVPGTPADAVVHNVFFTLSDPNDADALIEGCRKLSSIPGIVELQVGRREPSQIREVNDATFDVALVVVFDSVASLENYIVHPDHVAFVAEFTPRLAGVRVFDSKTSG